MSNYISVEVKDYIGIITINNPPLNVLSRSVVLELEKVLSNIILNKLLRAVIIIGVGEKSFSAGGNIKEFLDLDMQEGNVLAKKGQKALSLIEKVNVPVIAAINGLALGGGCEMALACDVRIMSDQGSIGLPETSLGIIPGYGGTQRLARLIGKGKAIMLISTAKILTAHEAYEIGLVDQVVNKEKVLESALKIAYEIAENAPKAVIAAKKAVYKGLEKNLEEGLALEAQLFGELCETEDKKAGVTAFINKEKPVYIGK